MKHSHSCAYLLTFWVLCLCSWCLCLGNFAVFNPQNIAWPLPQTPLSFWLQISLVIFVGWRYGGLKGTGGRMGGGSIPLERVVSPWKSCLFGCCCGCCFCCLYCLCCRSIAVASFSEVIFLPFNTTRSTVADSWRPRCRHRCSLWPHPFCCCNIDSYFDWETFQIIYRELYQGLGLCLAAVFIITLILIAHPLTAGLVFLMVTFTIVDVLGIM